MISFRKIENKVVVSNETPRFLDLKVFGLSNAVKLIFYNTNPEA